MAAIAFCKVSKLTELLRSLDGDGVVVSIASSSRLLVGKDPLNPDAIIDLGKEVVIARNRERNPSFLRAVR